MAMKKMARETLSTGSSQKTMIGATKDGFIMNSYYLNWAGF